VPYSRIPRIKDSVHDSLRKDLEKQAAQKNVKIDWASEKVSLLEKRTNCGDNLEVTMTVSYTEII
jgi:hypothetical protein